jgi:effector-binding domain-containing protein
MSSSDRETTARAIIDAVAAATAVVRVRTNRDEFKSLIRGLFDRVYASGTALRGHNVIVYRVAGEDLEMEVGVLLDTPVALRGELVPSATPSGRAATAVHIGPYDRIGETYDALIRWVEARGEKLGAGFWEVYGDWTDDPARLETRIYHLLA